MKGANCTFATYCNAELIGSSAAEEGTYVFTRDASVSLTCMDSSAVFEEAVYSGILPNFVITGYDERS